MRIIRDKKYLLKKKRRSNDNINNDNYYEWIDNILEKPFNDCQKNNII